MRVYNWLLILLMMPQFSVAQPASSTKEHTACKTVSIEVGAEPIGHRAQGMVCGKKRHGQWRFEFLTGEIMRKGRYEHGLETGLWQFYFRQPLRFANRVKLLRQFYILLFIQKGLAHRIYST